MTSKAAHTQAEKRQSRQEDRRRLLRELRSAAIKGDKAVWGRLSDSENVCGKELKAMLRTSLKNRQEPRCCYCNRWLLNIAHASPIEHVLPRKYYPQFALRARNLAIACYDCNSLKSDDDWGSFTEPHHCYPSTLVMGFFHPRYHSYDEHIRYLRIETNQQEFVTYKGLTPQGRHLCSELLSKVVGKQSLKRSYPKLSSWVRTLYEVGADQGSTYRPALQVFRDAMDKAIAERLNDGEKSSAFWAAPHVS
ncbi:HNH endonuclease [Pseudomonas neustonica]|uniref:HNH endonuclease n=1 Tax=Pseudomonas neustonica TaxID=2487346 RepID=UPI003F48D6FF